jgi:hypothetical protein
MLTLLRGALLREMPWAKVSITFVDSLFFDAPERDRSPSSTGAVGSMALVHRVVVTSGLLRSGFDRVRRDGDLATWRERVHEDVGLQNHPGRRM